MFRSAGPLAVVSGSPESANQPDFLGDQLNRVAPRGWCKEC